MNVPCRYIACLTCVLLVLIVHIAETGTAAAAAPFRHLDLHVTLDPATHEFRAIAEFIAPRDLRFPLHEALAVSAASADGKTIAIVPGAVHRNLREWNVSAPEGASVRIEYGGKLPALDGALDHRAVLSTSTPMTSPQGSFLQAGSGWYPAPPSLFSYRVTITVPGDQRALVAGHLSHEQPPSSGVPHYSATFELAHPVEGIDLMAGPYAIRERQLKRSGQEPIRLRTYFTPDLARLADGYLEDSRRYLELYSELIGPYPYDEFSVVSSPLPTGFGMPTLTYIGAQVLRLPFIRATSLGHEVLHNWWGNGVYPDYAKGNWSEGLTTFMADYFYKERDSAAAAREMRLSWLRDFAAIPKGTQQPLSTFRSRLHGAEAAVGYGKSAMVFFMLRDTIGEEAFARGIRSFWQEYRFKTASWDDLRLAFERASGQSLNGFFDQWVQRAGGPKVIVESASAREGDRSVALVVSQSTPSYTLHAPVALIRAASTEMRWLDIAQERQTVSLPVTELPDRVQFDPDLRLWRLLDESELPPILRMWIISRAPRVMIASANKDVRAAAIVLARSLFEEPPEIAASAARIEGNEPVLLIGIHQDVDRALAKLGFPARPANLAMRGTAQVWTVQSRKAPAVAVISAHDAGSLEALWRPLPHYGSQSYLVFEGSKMIDRGVWPVAGHMVPVAKH